MFNLFDDLSFLNELTSYLNENALEYELDKNVDIEDPISAMKQFLTDKKDELPDFPEQYIEDIALYLNLNTSAIIIRTNDGRKVMFIGDNKRDLVLKAGVLMAESLSSEYGICKDYKEMLEYEDAKERGFKVEPVFIVDGFTSDQEDGENGLITDFYYQLSMLNNNTYKNNVFTEVKTNDYLGLTIGSVNEFGAYTLEYKLKLLKRNIEALKKAGYIKTENELEDLLNGEADEYLSNNVQSYFNTLIEISDLVEKEKVSYNSDVDTIKFENKSIEGNLYPFAIYLYNCNSDDDLPNSIADII